MKNSGVSMGIAEVDSSILFLISSEIIPSSNICHRPDIEIFKALSLNSIQTFDHFFQRYKYFAHINLIL